MVIETRAWHWFTLENSCFDNVLVKTINLVINQDTKLRCVLLLSVFIWNQKRPVSNIMHVQNFIQNWFKILQDHAGRWGIVVQVIDHRERQGMHAVCGDGEGWIIMVEINIDRVVGKKPNPTFHWNNKRARDCNLAPLV